MPESLMSGLKGAARVQTYGVIRLKREMADIDTFTISLKDITVDGGEFEDLCRLFVMVVLLAVRFTEKNRVRFNSPCGDAPLVPCN